MDDIYKLKSLIDNGYLLIGATNQSGIARGIIEDKLVKDLNFEFIGKHGLTNFYYCPHHPDEHCSCRKPEPEMLFKARAEHGIDLKRSFVVGDSAADMLLARAVGAKGVLIESDRSDASTPADFRAESLTEAVKWITGQP